MPNSGLRQAGPQPVDPGSELGGWSAFRTVANRSATKILRMDNVHNWTTEASVREEFEPFGIGVVRVSIVRDSNTGRAKYCLIEFATVHDVRRVLERGEWDDGWGFVYNFTHLNLLPVHRPHSTAATGQPQLAP